MIPVRTKVSWTRWDADRLRMVTSNPYAWSVTEPDGYERTFDTKAQAQDFIDRYEAEAA